jgi:hypothetical protein
MALAMQAHQMPGSGQPDADFIPCKVPLAASSTIGGSIIDPGVRPGASLGVALGINDAQVKQDREELWQERDD